MEPKRSSRKSIPSPSGARLKLLIELPKDAEKIPYRSRKDVQGGLRDTKISASAMCYHKELNKKEDLENNREQYKNNNKNPRQKNK